MTPRRRSLPRTLALRAALLVAAYGVAHLAGLRPLTTILSGSSPPSSLPPLAASALGCAYVVLHFAAIVVAPILAIAAALLAAADRLAPGRATERAR